MTIFTASVVGFHKAFHVYVVYPFSCVICFSAEIKYKERPSETVWQKKG